MAFNLFVDSSGGYLIGSIHLDFINSKNESCIVVFERSRPSKTSWSFASWVQGTNGTHWAEFTGRFADPETAEGQWKGSECAGRGMLDPFNITEGTWKAHWVGPTLPLPRQGPKLGHWEGKDPQSVKFDLIDDGKGSYRLVGVQLDFVNPKNEACMVTMRAIQVTDLSFVLGVNLVNGPMFQEFRGKFTGSETAEGTWKGSLCNKRIPLPPVVFEGTWAAKWTGE